VADVPLAGHEIAVERRRAGQSSWTTYRTVDTSPSGSVGVTVRPVVNTSYRLVAAAGDDYAAVTSDSVRVEVRPLLTVSGHHRIAAKSADHLTVTSAPEQRGRVTLQRRRHGHWVEIAHGKLGPTGQRRFTIHPARVGITRYRVVLAATDHHLGATSDPLVVTVH
jgi:hypothetical protein